MTDIAPEAIEAVAGAIRASVPEVRFEAGATSAFEIYGEHALAFIRDAIHRDGDDADAIRQALGLRREVTRKDASTIRGWRAVGDWQAVS